MVAQKFQLPYIALILLPVKLQKINRAIGAFNKFTVLRGRILNSLNNRVVTHARRDSLAAIAFEKNRRRVSNTCDLRCRLYFARLDARILLARDHLHEVDFNVSRVPGQSRARVNSKSYTIYESHGYSAMHKCFASRRLQLS